MEGDNKLRREVSEFTRTRRRTDAATLAQMYPEMRARAFAVQGIEDFNKLKRVQDAVAALSEGGRWEELRGRIADELGGDEANARRHAETVLRTNGFQAYGAARWRAQQARKDVFPYLKYVTMGDGRGRDSHAALDGIILPVDDPFWENHYPPWDFNCRCMVVQLSEAGLNDEIEAGEGELWSKAARDDYVARYRGRDEARPYQFRAGSVEIDVRSLAQAKGRTREEMIEFGKLMEGRRVGTGKFARDGREIETNVREWLLEPVRRDYRERVLKAQEKDGMEHLYLIDAWTGKELNYFKGTATGAEGEVALLDNESVLAIHNHPGGNVTLSPTDVTTAMRDDVYSMESVTQNARMRLRWRDRDKRMRDILELWNDLLKTAYETDDISAFNKEWIKWLDKQCEQGYFDMTREEL